MATTGPWPVACVATMNAAIEATVPTDRSMPPVSIASVWQPARIASGIAARMVKPTQVGLTVPGCDELEDHDEDERAAPSAGSAADRGTAPPASRRACGRRVSTGPAAARHRRTRRIEMRLPNITTPMRISALDGRRQVGIDAEQGQVGPDQLRGSTHRHDRPDDAAASAGEADAAEHDRGHALERVRTRDRRPEPVARGDAPARRTPQNSPPIA